MEAGKLLVPAADRVAITESAAAWGEQTTEGLDAAGKVQPILWKRWEAMLDRKTCGLCADHDNEVVRADADFHGGAIPGMVHPRCRCEPVPALYSADLDVGHAISRIVVGPGAGRTAADAPGRPFISPSEWTEAQKSEWVRLYKKAHEDEDYRARLLTPEVRRHLRGIRKNAPVVPRIPKYNPKSAGAYTPTEIYEKTMGKLVGLPKARWEYGTLVPTP